MSETGGFEQGPRLARPSSEFVSDRELYDVVSRRFGMAQSQLDALQQGSAVPELVDAPDALERGIFAHSAEAFVGAETEAAREQAWKYFYNDTAAQLFEAVTHSGHIETFSFPIDKHSGDALTMPGITLGETYVRDLAAPNKKWRAELSFIEFMNTAAIAELSKRGILHDHVLIEASCFAYDVPINEAAKAGYRPDNEKGYLRSSTDQDSQRVMQTLSYSHLTPAEVEELALLLDMPVRQLESTKEALQHTFVIPKYTYEQIGGIAGLAGLIDGIKQRRDGQPRYFGNHTEEVPDPLRYAAAERVSAERKVRAKEASAAYAEEVLLSYIAFRSGAISFETAFRQMANSLIEARNRVLLGDRDLTVEHHGEAIAQKVDHLRELYESDRFSEAMVFEKILQKDLGTIYVCGLQMQIDIEGNLIGPGGESVDCKEIRNGDVGQCPGCKHTVAIIVDPNNREKLYCPRSECPLSMSSGKASHEEDAAVDSHSKTSNDLASLLLAHVSSEQFSLAA